KQEAEELKNLLQGVTFGYGGDFPYQNWLPTLVIDNEGAIDQKKFKSIAVYSENGTVGSANPELIKELDKIIEQQSQQKDKCADCQQEKDSLLDFQDNNQTIKICSECK